LIDTIPAHFFSKIDRPIHGLQRAFAQQLVVCLERKSSAKSVFELPEAIPFDWQIGITSRTRDYSKLDVQVFERTVQCADGVSEIFLFTKAPFNNFAGDGRASWELSWTYTERKSAEERCGIRRAKAAILGGLRHVACGVLDPSMRIHLGQ